MDNSTLRNRPRFRAQIESPRLTLPPNVTLGSVIALAPDADGGLWILHQPTVQQFDDQTTVAPPVARFDKQGNYAYGWGGPNHIPMANGVSQWPDGLENIEMDADGNLWIFGYKPGDDAVLKFSPSGELLLRIGARGVPGDDDSLSLLGRPTSAYHNVDTREVFISDGYANHRVIAFDSDTGQFTRMWGAYGRQASSLSAAEGFGNPVHKVAAGPDGRLYVADRIKNRVQEFELVPGGARFLREVSVAPGTLLFGSAFDIAFSHDGRHMYVADGSNRRIWIVDMSDFNVCGWVGGLDDAAGSDNLPAIYSMVHRFAPDAQGNLLLACVTRGVKQLTYEGT